MSNVTFRLLLFVTLFALLAIAERLWPRHGASPDRNHRWPTNLGVGLLDALCLRLLLPWLAVDAAVWAQAEHVGVLHQLRMPSWLAAVIAFVILDLVIYFQHRLMHGFDPLWRLHRMHHTDVALDASSGVRFHPLEILFSMGIKIAVVLLLGAGPGVVAVFEIVLSSFSLMTHANLRLPLRLDATLRWVFVTPDMHRVHHSVLREEHDSNYGFNITWWDRLFGSYTPRPRKSQETMPLGLKEFRDARAQRMRNLLLQPARSTR